MLVVKTSKEAAPWSGHTTCYMCAAELTAIDESDIITWHEPEEPPYWGGGTMCGIKCPECGERLRIDPPKEVKARNGWQ